jgi:hypothetical protein
MTRPPATHDRAFALPPLPKAAIVFAWLLGAGLPAGIGAVLAWQARQGALEPLVALAGQAVVAVTVLAVVLPLWRRRIAFDGRRLRVEATYYTREAPLSDFALDQARVVDLREHAALRPALKSNGYALPGFQAGHFRLRDWKRKAFCLVTDPAKVLALPHADGSTWLLSFEHPQAVLDILRRA